MNALARTSNRGNGRRSQAAVAVFVCCFIALRLACIRHPFWEDESFSALAATQDFPAILQLSRQDVHPPGYYLLLRAWNQLGLRLSGKQDPAREIRLIQFDYQDKRWSAIQSGGAVIHGRNGVMPADWEQYNLLPLTWLRLSSILLALAAALGAYNFVRRCAPARPETAWCGLLLIAVSPYSIYWSTIIRNYCAYGMLLCVALPVCAWACQNEAQPRKFYGGFILCGALLLGAAMTNYLALLYFPLFLLVPWLTLPSAKNWIACALTPVLAFFAFWLLWGGTLTGQLAYAEYDWFDFAALPGRAAHYAGIHFHFFWRIFFSFAATQDLIWDALSRGDWLTLFLLGFCGLLFAAATAAAVYSCCFGAEKKLLLFLALAANLPQIIFCCANLLRYESLPFFDRYFFPTHILFCIFLGVGIDDFLRHKSGTYGADR